MWSAWLRQGRTTETMLALLIAPSGRIFRQNRGSGGGPVRAQERGVREAAQQRLGAEADLLLLRGAEFFGGGPVRLRGRGADGAPGVNLGKRLAVPGRPCQ